VYACSSHISQILGKNPVTIGHEATGYVVQTGTGEVASKLKEGDAVGFICAVDCCFECKPCKTVHNAYCVTGKAKMQGFSADGYFAEYAVVDARNAIVLPEERALLLFLAETKLILGCSGCQGSGTSILRRADLIPWR
jgi:propanol-preferring alcohol dehydrogenase